VILGRHWRTRALAAVAALTAITFTAGCAGPGSGTAGGQHAGGQHAVGQQSVTATASGAAPGSAASVIASSTASSAAAPASGSAAVSVSSTASPTLARLGTVTPAASASPSASPADSAASGPPPTGAADQRLVTFVNRMSQTIWVAAAPSATSPLSATGWVLPAGQSVTIAAPNNLNTRFWGRTGCVFSSAGVGHCQTGDCGGLFQCKGWGTIPATLAEVNFDAWDGLDFYDVSMVDGSNLPMWINIGKSSGGTVDRISSNGCVAAGCTKAVNCPSALAVTSGTTVVACESACAKLGGAQYCCTGQYSARPDCNPATWPIDYAAVFKDAEPYAYSYADDDATSVFTCSGVCDYRITFGLST